MNVEKIMKTFMEKKRAEETGIQKLMFCEEY